MYLKFSVLSFCNKLIDVIMSDGARPEMGLHGQGNKNLTYFSEIGRIQERMDVVREKFSDGEKQLRQTFYLT